MIEFKILILILIYFSIAQFRRAKTLRIDMEHKLVNLYTLRSLLIHTEGNSEINLTSSLNSVIPSFFHRENEHSIKQRDLPLNEIINLVQAVTSKEEKTGETIKTPTR